jgi:hypothetical protein
MLFKGKLRVPQLGTSIVVELELEEKAGQAFTEATATAAKAAAPQAEAVVDRQPRISRQKQATGNCMQYGPSYGMPKAGRVTRKEVKSCDGMLFNSVKDAAQYYGLDIDDTYRYVRSKTRFSYKNKSGKLRRTSLEYTGRLLMPYRYTEVMTGVKHDSTFSAYRKGIGSYSELKRDVRKNWAVVK